MRLGLGTVQFGMDYGISNRAGQTPPDEVVEILDRASEAGVEVLDTAPAYGSAERVIGASGLAGRFRIVTKTPVLIGTSPAERADAVERSLYESLRRLRVDAVAGLLVHAVADLAGDAGEGLARRLVSLREQGLVGRVGISVYSADDLHAAREVFAPDIVQLPLSIYDQRMLADRSIDTLVATGAEVHTRSALLQGVLVMSASELPPHFAGVRAHHERYLEAITELGLSPLQSAIGFALGVQGPTTVLVGVNTLAQLQELLRVAPVDSRDLARWALDDPDMLNPARWNRA